MARAEKTTSNDKSECYLRLAVFHVFVTNLGMTLRAETDLDRLREQLLKVVEETMQPALH